VNTPLQSVLLVLLAAFIGSFGAVFLKAGSSRLHRQVRTLILNWRLALGIALFLVSSYFFVLAMREGELSILYPINSFAYVWTMIWSRFFFQEPITRRKVAGLALILLGITILFAGRGKTGEPVRAASSAPLVNAR
jgi:multidrug transporter EmrE-like cation transporter